MAAAGTRPFLVDWGAPGELERGFSLTDYIAGRLEQALDRVLAEVGGPVVLLGYCMGGLLAVALALRRQRDLAGLVCLATPWDFHAERPSQAKLLGASLEATIELNLGIRNCSVTEFAFTPQRHRLVTFNTLPHLDAPEHAGWVTFA